MQGGEPLAVRGPGGEPSRIVVEAQFDHVHAATLGVRPRRPLYHAILRAWPDSPTCRCWQPSTPQRLERLAAAAPARTVAAGTVLAVRGEPATHLIVVETGGVTAVHDTATGRRRRLGEFAAPCAVDKAAVLDGGGHTATWLAGARSRIRPVPAAEFLAVLDDVPAARHHVLTHLAGQLRDQQDDLVLASFADAVTRTAAWLVRAAGTNGSRVVLPGAQEGLAEAIGMTRVSVNRALRTLAAGGLVRVEPGAVVILAPELLALRANPDAPTEPVVRQ
ncbi:MAG: helix-turn-helix domain-containing protein [Actinophytocola sp.]|uniref:Crp/Fnr family transcriptional regulator n=1 Tax=Actinophytocola sp. TaxID=1872138 RepID=UPI0013283AC1|nr:Crp/Fnr family transcriptional regulator [Actinophytocola sp.]MPZ83895.1 helix-turn-helix domain-containing protein [Actinophytocola sp.]